VYEPETVALVIVAESPPESGKYFYNPEGRPTEPLFAAMMGHVGLPYSTKHEGLLNFQRRGWVLVDATYEPVNRRDQIIERDYPLLRDDLAALTPDRSAPVVLIKANVCRLLQDRLAREGFNVLNRGVAVFFPAIGRQAQFRRQFGAVLEAAGIRPRAA
jgi:hypothetical protein